MGTRSQPIIRDQAPYANLGKKAHQSRGRISFSLKPLAVDNRCDNNIVFDRIPFLDKFLIYSVNL